MNQFEATDEMIDAACEAADLFRVDAMKAVEAAFNVYAESMRSTAESCNVPPAVLHRTIKDLLNTLDAKDAEIALLTENDMRPTNGMDRQQFYDKAWSLWQEKAIDSALLPKLSVHAIRTLWDVLYESMPVATSANVAQGAVAIYQAKIMVDPKWSDVTKSEFDRYVELGGFDTRIVYAAPPAQTANVSQDAVAVAWREEAQKLFTRCKLWPEKSDDGFMALLELRNHVEKLLKNDALTAAQSASGDMK